MDNLLDLIHVLGKNLGGSITIRQLAAEAGVPYTTANRIIKQKKGLFVLEKKGSSILCSLNTEDRITVSFLALAERKKADDLCRADKEISIIRRDLPEGVYAAVLFGSRASGKQRKESDVDILVINNDGKRNVSFSRQAMLFRMKINPIFMSIKEFRHMLGEKEHNLADEIVKNHVILYGEEYFWRAILEDRI